jgi:hypothetical protein
MTILSVSASRMCTHGYRTFTSNQGRHLSTLRFLWKKCVKKEEKEVRPTSFLANYWSQEEVEDETLRLAADQEFRARLVAVAKRQQPKPPQSMSTPPPLEEK